MGKLPALCIGVWFILLAVMACGESDASYYPSYHKLRVKVDAPAGSTRADLRLADPGGRELWKGQLLLKDGKGENLFDVPDTLEGDFTLTATPDNGAPPFTRKFKRVRYPWEGNTLGITDEVYPPFTPITVDRKKVSVVLRDYELDGLGLFRAVTSEKEAVLAAPMQLLVNGRPVAKASGKFTSVKKSAVVYDGAADLPAVMIRTHNTLEFDGCMRVELTLQPGDKKTPLQSLRLEIPVRNDIAPFWHVVRGGIRSNPAGDVPAGEGRVWDSTRTPSLFWYGTFLPYLWLGNEEQGIAWFADNDHYWGADPDGKLPCLTLDRAGQTLTLGVNLVQVPEVVTAPRTIVFGLIASPVKPMPANWRTFLGGQNRVSIVGSQYWAGDSREKAKYPRGYDFSALDQSRQVRLTGRFDPDFIEKVWIPKHTTPEMTKELVSVFRNRLNAFLNGASGARNGGYFSAYYEEGGIAIAHPELQTFGYEWSSGDFSGTWLEQNAGLTLINDGQLGPGSTGNAFRASYRDFAAWYGSEFIKRGVGLYFDNTFYRNQPGTLDGDAYFQPKMNNGKGDYQPSAKVWALREYYKRMWTLHRQFSPADTPAMMVLHMTNGEVLSHVAFADAVLDLEWKDNLEPAQIKYTPDLLRAESLGLHTGAIPMGLANLWGNSKGAPKEKIDQAMRTRFGVFMVHEMLHPWEPPVALLKPIRNFGYGKDDCRVWNYWKKNYPVKVDDPLVKSLTLKRGNELLLVLCTWNPEPKQPVKDAGPKVEGKDEVEVPTAPLTKTVILTLDTAALGVKPTRVIDEETLEELKFDAATGTVQVPMVGYGVRMIRVQ